MENDGLTTTHNDKMRAESLTGNTTNAPQFIWPKSRIWDIFEKSPHHMSIVHGTNNWNLETYRYKLENNQFWHSKNFKVTRNHLVFFTDSNYYLPGIQSSIVIHKLVPCPFVRYFRTLFWDDMIICWWKLSKQTSYWSKTGFFSQLKK